MDFISGKSLLDLCDEKRMSIADVMRERESSEGECDASVIEEKMKKALCVMRKSAHEPIEKPQKSKGGLIGGEANKLYAHAACGKSILSGAMSKALIYSQAIPEVNASMGVIVAAPTAGAAGVLPAVLFALEEEFSLSEKTVLDGLFTAGAIGYLLTRNSSVSGANAGCQAEIGSASAMAAAAAVSVMGGTPARSLDAASTAITNLLGLVCDPVAGLVEYPCQNRNAVGAANALVCAELALSGIRALIPFDETARAMLRVGCCLPKELRETALGGCAATPTAIGIKQKILK